MNVRTAGSPYFPGMPEQLLALSAVVLAAVATWHIVGDLGCGGWRRIALSVGAAAAAALITAAVAYAGRPRTAAAVPTQARDDSVRDEPQG